MSSGQGGTQGAGQGAREFSLTASLTKLPAPTSEDTAQGGKPRAANSTRKQPKTGNRHEQGRAPSLSEAPSPQRTATSRRVANTPRRLTSLATAAAYADVSTRTLRRYIAQGRLTGYRVGPRLVKVDLHELETLARPIPTTRTDHPTR